MKNDDMLATARNAVAMAKKYGASDATADVRKQRRVTITWRDGRVEKVQEATMHGTQLALYVDGRYASMGTSDLRPDALEAFISNAVGLARVLTQDPHRALTDPKLYEGQSDVDLNLLDPTYDSLNAAQYKVMAAELEAAARGGGEGSIVSVTTSVGDSFAHAVRVCSNGFEGSDTRTRFNTSAETTVKDTDGRRPAKGDSSDARIYAELASPESVGRAATERARLRLGATKGPSGVMTIAIENRAVPRLLSHLLRAMSASGVQQKRSFLEGQIGQSIGSALLTLTDDPLVPKGLGSRKYDGDSIAAKRFGVIADGVLTNYYVDNYYGRKLGVAPTTGGTSNLQWQLGDKDQAGLLADLGEGILVTGFLGGNSNSTTGDFSLGIEGFAVRGGTILEPLSEMNISGNQIALWKQLTAVGNDPYPYTALSTPTLVFEGVQVSGK